MVRGLYTAWTGLSNEQKRLDIISNNLANSTTVGFKQDSVTNQSFEHHLTLKIKDSSENFNNKAIGTMSLGVKLGEVYTNHQQGSLRETSNTYDLALDGKGFFALSVTDRNGNESTQYTRDGAFTLTQDGYLVNFNGEAVLGESGEISIPVDASQVVIDKDGSIYADGAFVDKVKVVDFEDYNYIRKMGNNRYAAVQGATTIDGTATINQGYTEQSNVNVVSEMVDMIAITRAYEANQKVMQTIDSTLEQSVMSVGKL